MCFRACLEHVFATCLYFGAVCFVGSVFCFSLVPCPRPLQSQIKYSADVCARVSCVLETPVFYAVHVLVSARVREVYVRTHLRACVRARVRGGARIALSPRVQRGVLGADCLNLSIL
jgi:hypothetical protein